MINLFIARGKTRGKAVSHIHTGYKKAIYGRHIIFFRTGVDQVVEIIRVLHAAMDMENKLTGEQ